MTNDKNPVWEYLAVTKRITEYFKCDSDFFIKPLPDCYWAIKNDDNFYFLSYWKNNEARTDSVVVKKGGEPMIFEVDEYTMVVGIDCVKIGFIFSNSNKKI